MPLDTSKQASMYVKGYIQNIWKRDEATGAVVVPYEKTGEQFKVVQTINLSEPRPGQALTMEQYSALVKNTGVDVSTIESPRPSK